ncbi:MAG TPA: hypothetical protein VNA12_10170 [Mycobacteriales bacterium]|nr:hypothetical protein [Mycobacteriales bacterium]
MGRHSRRRRYAPRGPLAVLLALAVAAQLLAGLSALRLRADDSRSSRASVGRGADETTATARRAALEERADSVRALLDRRARAVLTRDRALFLSVIDPQAADFRQRQARVFDALADVPIGSWVYDLNPDRETPYDPSLLGHYGTDTWVPEIVLRYQLEGFDPHPAASEQYLTFVRRDAGWLLANDDDFPGVPSLQTERELWDFGPVEVVRGRHTLVLGRRGRRPMLQEIARQSDAAVPRVTKVWGADWTQRVVVLVPETQAELGTILSEGNDLSQIAAVAVAQLGGADLDVRTVGNRIIVNPPNFAKLTRLGRQVVLQHEITHVATRDHTGPATPVWLIEGFADYVGYLGSGISVRSAARELRADVRAGRVPAVLPGDEEFGGTHTSLAQSYEMAWLACRLIAERTGARGLVAFYRYVGTTHGVAVDVRREGFRRVLSTTPESFTTAWRGYLRSELG